MNNLHITYSFLQSISLYSSVDVSYIEVQVDCVLGYE